MNNTQKLFRAITGYEINEPASARDDYYFEIDINDHDAQIAHLKAYADEVLNLNMSEREITHTNHALHAKKESSDDWYRIYDSLSLTNA